MPCRGQQRIGRARLRQAGFGVGGDVGIQRGIERGDTVEVELRQFDAADFLGAQRAAELLQT